MKRKGLTCLVNGRGGTAVLIGGKWCTMGVCVDLNLVWVLSKVGKMKRKADPDVKEECTQVKSFIEVWN